VAVFWNPIIKKCGKLNLARPRVRRACASLRHSKVSQAESALRNGVFGGKRGPVGTVLMLQGWGKIVRKRRNEMRY
jgi:hypothetical protein